MTHELVRTRLGAAAVKDNDCGEVMHPGVGPRVEAEELYVRQSRLAERLSRTSSTRPLVLFDVGLGAGSNAFAARAAALATPGARLEIVSFERDLGALRLALAHAADFGIDDAAAAAARALLAQGESAEPSCTWRLRHGELLAALAAEPTRADVVFWDPFSPRANPDLWTEAAFAAVRARVAPGATLFTYSSSTTTRVAMLLGGWAVGQGDAIGDKAETTAAAVEVADLARPLDARFLARLARSDAPLPPDAARRAALAPQFATSATTDR